MGIVCERGVRKYHDSQRRIMERVRDAALLWKTMGMSNCTIQLFDMLPREARHFDQSGDARKLHQVGESVAQPGYLVSK